MNFIELKETIKLNAEYLKYCRLTRKQHYATVHEEMYKKLEALLYTRHEKYGYRVRRENNIVDNIRLYHIAYSMLKGHKYEEIENKVRSGNELTSADWNNINAIMEEVHAANVCANS